MSTCHSCICVLIKGVLNTTPIYMDVPVHALAPRNAGYANPPFRRVTGLFFWASGTGWTRKRKSLRSSLWASGTGWTRKKKSLCSSLWAGGTGWTRKKTANGTSLSCRFFFSSQVKLPDFFMVVQFEKEAKTMSTCHSCICVLIKGLLLLYKWMCLLMLLLQGPRNAGNMPILLFAESLGSSFGPAGLVGPEKHKGHTLKFPEIFLGGERPFWLT